MDPDFLAHVYVRIKNATSKGDPFLAQSMAATGVQHPAGHAPAECSGRHRIQALVAQPLHIHPTDSWMVPGDCCIVDFKENNRGPEHPMRYYGLLAVGYRYPIKPMKSCGILMAIGYVNSAFFGCKQWLFWAPVLTISTCTCNALIQAPFSGFKAAVISNMSSNQTTRHVFQLLKPKTNIERISSGRPASTP